MLNLAGVLRASIGDEGDSRVMQADALLKVAEQKLNKALDQLDWHDSRHSAKANDTGPNAVQAWLTRCP